MINREEFQELLESTGYPVAYYVFPKDEPHEPPFICWIVTGNEILHADDVTYLTVPQVQVELYTLRKDESAERIVEMALADFAYLKDEGMLQDEQMYMVTYQTSLEGGNEDEQG